VAAERSSICLVDRSVISDICHEDSGFDYVYQARAVLGQKTGEVGNGLCRLRSNPARDDRPVPRAQLAGHDQPRASRDNRRVRAYRRGTHRGGR
jgi:hypothetical protein